MQDDLVRSHRVCAFQGENSLLETGTIRSVIFVAAVISLAFISMSAAGAVQDPADPPKLEEVIVTAQKRGAENLQDVAMSAAVVSSELIDLKQLVGMDDYLRTIPSLAFQEYGAGRSAIIIRGITADPQLGTGTTAVYIDEAPLSGMGNFGNSSPDLKLVDVNRIEILRGPQGTLYGSGSMGGTVRFITEQPRLDEISGSVTGSWSYTDGPGSGNYSGEAILNLPLQEDAFAIRAVAYYFDNSGYYRNVAADDPLKQASAEATGGLLISRDDVGNSTYKGGRISALWNPTDQLSISLMYLGQRIDQEGTAYGDLAIGEFEQSRYSRTSTGKGQFNKDDLSVLNLLVDYDFGSVGMVSSSSWNDYQTIEDWDVGQFWTFIYEEDAPIWINNITRTKSFVQELRFTSQWDAPVNFLAGMYYENRKPTLKQVVEWDGDPAYDPFGGELLFGVTSRQKVEQLAFFGELSWDITEKLTATAGMRAFSYEKSFNDEGDGIFADGPFVDSASSKENDETYLVNVSYRPSEQSLYYAQWSQGFRLGEPLPATPDFCDADGDGLLDGLGLPAQEQVDSDTLDAFEVGGKWSLMGNRLEIRSAAFYNKWSKIPISLIADCAYSFLFNAGEAMTAGFELEGSAQLSDHWRLDFSFGYLEGELTSDAPGLGLDGDRLPGSPNYNATLGLQYDFLYRSRNAFLRADLATVGGYYNNLQEEGMEIGDYNTVNLAAGILLGQWDLQLFIQNLTNSSAATWINAFPEYPSAYRLRPRTAGFSLRYDF